MKTLSKSVVGGMALLLALVACKKEGNQVLAPLPPDPARSGVPASGMPAKKASMVVVPEALKGKWKAVRIVVVEVASKKETTHIVPVGADFLVPGTGLTLWVENLLPDFTMGGGVITSKSEQLANPAVQVRVSEGAKEVFKGWMFAKFPDTHAYQHPKFALKLVDFVL